MRAVSHHLGIIDEDPAALVVQTAPDSLGRSMVRASTIRILLPTQEFYTGHHRTHLAGFAKRQTSPYLLLNRSIASWMPKRRIWDTSRALSKDSASGPGAWGARSCSCCLSLNRGLLLLFSSLSLTAVTGHPEPPVAASAGAVTPRSVCAALHFAARRLGTRGLAATLQADTSTRDCTTRIVTGVYCSAGDRFR